MRAGVLQVGATNALPTGSYVSMTNAAGAALDVNGFSQTIGDLAGGGTTGGNITLGSGTLTVGSTSSTTYSAPLAAWAAASASRTLARSL